MAISANKRSIMTLYAAANDPHSHRVRLVLAEKGVNFELIDVHSSTRVMEELLELNPYGSYPTLIDRDLVLYQSEIIMEYLDERFPHPPLLPVYPVAKGRTRLMIYRINNDWYSLMDKILDTRTDSLALAELRKKLLDSLVGAAPAFSEMPYFLSEEFSLVDCCLAPLLWRLPQLSIELPPQAAAITEYAQKVFKRESFQASIAEVEKFSKVY